MKLKQLLCIICIILGMTTIANAFTDLPSTHWAYNDVQKMASEGIVSGYNDGSFKPEKNVTNEEFATILTKVLGLKADSNPIKFEDVASDRWSKPYIDAMSKYYTYKTSEGKNYFDPFGAATREEVAAAVVRAMGLDGQTPDYTVLEQFSDKNEINSNLKSYIAIAVKNGIMSGNANGTFRPKKNLTRAQIAALMNNVKSKNIVEKHDTLSSETPPTMAKQDTWYKGITDKGTITKITFMDSYKSTGSETEIWNADTENKGTIKCYVIGTELIIAGNGNGKIYANEDSSCMFFNINWSVDSQFSRLQVINNLNLLDTTRIVDMNAMFLGCQSLKNIDVSKWNTSNVINMNAMFLNCYSLETIDISNWNIGKVTDMSYMFGSCTSLKTIDISKWDTSKCNVNKMFDGCSSLNR